MGSKREYITKVLLGETLTKFINFGVQHQQLKLTVSLSVGGGVGGGSGGSVGSG